MRTQNIQFDKLTVGVCYYPEHWDRSLWAEDLDRMLEAGISVVRIAEFSWTMHEPEEGHYVFGLFDEFLQLCAEKGMQVIIGTPTATPPAWLTTKYPEVCNCSIDGTPYVHGARRHYNYNAEIYREKCAAIVEAMASHYGQHPAVIGWQIDNEINCETDEFYSEADSAAFRAWARERYGTLEALNEAWGTAVWSQIYTDWKEIRVPGHVLNNGHNPHVKLDYFRFVSDSAVRFTRLQADIIRKYKKPGDFITTNGLFGNLDNHRLQDDCLDLYMYDSYPNFAYGLNREGYYSARKAAGAPYNTGDLEDRRWSMHLAETRSVCPHFGIMEQQSGPGSWTNRMAGPSPRPGQVRLWAMQSVAHGADFVSFFRWRTAPIGTEIYWYGILGHDNRDNRRLAEVKDFQKDLEQLEQAGLCGAEHVAAFGLIRDYDNQYDARVDDWHNRMAWKSEMEIWAASELSHRPMDFVDLRDETPLEALTAYPVLFYPHPMIMTEARAALLKAYVEQGGTLVLGARSGYKDAEGHCVMMPGPGLLATVAGVTVGDFTMEDPSEEPVGQEMDGIAYGAPVFREILEVPEESADLRVLSRYTGEDCWYAGAPALTEHVLGAGRCFYLGGVFSREMVNAILDRAGAEIPCFAGAQLPETVEAVVRETDGRAYLFLLNYARHEVLCGAPEGKTFRDVLTGETLDGAFRMPAFGVRVVTESAES